VAAAVAAVASGRSLRDVADEYGVSFVTVSRWVAKHKAQAAKAPKKPKPAAKAAHPWTGITATLAERSEPPPPADEGPEEAEGGTLLEQVQGLQRAMLATARESKRVGNMKAAQAALASAGLLANTIARISKTEAEGADVFRVSMAEIKATEESLRARLGTMRGRPLCCAVCSRKLSVAMAYEGREMPDVIREYLESEA
jgi:hypothetical protein